MCGIRARHDLTPAQTALKKRFAPVLTELKGMSVQYTLKADGIRPAIHTGAGVWVQTESLEHAQQVLTDLKAARVADTPLRQARPPSDDGAHQRTAKKVCPSTVGAGLTAEDGAADNDAGATEDGMDHDDV